MYDTGNGNLFYAIFLYYGVVMSTCALILVPRILQRVFYLSFLGVYNLTVEMN